MNKDNTKFDSRKLMQLAIKVMRRSVSEPRSDGKVDPKVGVVLYKPDGTVETSCRGELRHGDHAEFTILERKNRGNKLDNSILFVTLEPCAIGSRSSPKLSCSERIYLARIKEVWIGIQDPDPTVARKGIGYLLRKHISVHMFDRDLQEEIEKENDEFLKQATERAEVVEDSPSKVSLSNLENSLPKAELNDFSPDALSLYREKAKIADEIGSKQFNRRLVRQGLIYEDNGNQFPTGFGFILFGKEPRINLPQAGLLGLIKYPNGKTERKEFDEPAVLIPDKVEKWLKYKLPNVLVRDQVFRKERSTLPFEMVREAVSNALIHRDYNITEAKCHIIVTDFSITIKSPGQPPPPITLEQLKDFSAPMLSRNPELHFVFAKMEMAEEQGLGLQSLRNKAKEYGLPLPKYTWEEPYLVLTIYLSEESASKAIDTEILAKLSKSEKKGWEWLFNKGSTNSSEYAEVIGAEQRTARRHLSHFEELGLVSKTGSGRSLRYKVR